MKNFDEEKKTNQEIKPESDTLVDPMVFYTEEERKANKEKWMSIFYRCPELCDRIMNLWSDIGEKGMKYLDEFIMNGFSEYYRAAITADTEEG